MTLPVSPPERTLSPFPCGVVSGVNGRALALRGDDIDTDRIIPARFLKCVSFEGLGASVFADDRAEQEGHHPFDRAEHQGASILVVNRNFGCGSSREHAPQALMRWGIRALIGESFAEIFFGNGLALGIPCLTASHRDVLDLQAAIGSDPAAELSIDLETLEVRTPRGRWPLFLAEGPRRMFLSGQWDGTSQLLAHHRELEVTAARLPYLSAFAP
jgi:3-isopropylmalate/(R)-2-methylmalate dehydratase small subunit